MNLLRFFFKSLFYLIVLFMILGLAAWGVTYRIYSEDLPDVRSLRDVQFQVPLRIYDREGGLIAEFGEKRREPVGIEQVPEIVKKAFLAAEDDRFYEHPGVDIQGLLRAGWELLRTGYKGQGGSTVTMQVARNFFLSSEKTYSRKFKEILLAIKIEKNLTKDEILELYLNKIYLGNRAYGVAAASSIYFNKPLDALSAAEAAMLAGLPKAPSRFNPAVNPKRAKIRRDYILRRMRDLGWLSEEGLSMAIAEPVSSEIYLNAAVDLKADYVAEMVRAKVVAQFGEHAYEMGLKVHTTLDPRLQRAAVDALRKALLDYDRRHGWRGPERHVELGSAPVEVALRAAREAQPIEGLLAATVIQVGEKDARVIDADGREHLLDMKALQWARPYRHEDAMGPKPRVAGDVLVVGDVIRLAPDAEGMRLAQLPQPSAAMVVFDPASGALLALQGGFDFGLSKFNRAYQALRQPGSVFKPFLYSAALEHGFTLASVISDEPLVFEKAAANEKDWVPQNYAGKSYGPTRMHEALVRSQNLVSIRIMDAITPQVALDHARLFGLPVDQWMPTLSLALGSYALTPYQLASAYMVFANGGYRVAPYFIERIEDIHGNVLYQAPKQVLCDVCPPGAEASAPRVLSAENVWLSRLMLRDVTLRGTAANAGRALKRRDIGGKTGTTNDQRDAWFSGYGPGVVATAWVGFDDYRPLGRRETGGVAALPMWIDFMRVALDGMPISKDKMPKGIIAASVDAVTGLPTEKGAPGSIIEYFDKKHPLLTTAIMPEALPPQEVFENMGDARLVEDLF